MDPATLMVIPGLLGGLVIAFVIFAFKRPAPGSSPDAFARDPLSTDVINASRIRVAGIGGLGLVLVAATVAFTIPQIGLSLLVGLVSGVAMAAVLILRRRHNGPMPSSGQQPGANTTLAIDRPEVIEKRETPGARHHLRHRAIWLSGH
jgi:hypothetical protein